MISLRVTPESGTFCTIAWTSVPELREQLAAASTHAVLIDFQLQVSPLTTYLHLHPFHSQLQSFFPLLICKSDLPFL